MEVSLKKINIGRFCSVFVKDERLEGLLTALPKSVIRSISLTCIHGEAEQFRFAMIPSENYNSQQTIIRKPDWLMQL